MVKFRTLAEIQEYLLSEKIVNKVLANERVRNLIASEISKSVKEVVYKAYTPKEYIRRMDNGGLSDPNNVIITKVEIIGNKISIYIENITKGQTNYLPIYGNIVDSLDNKQITDTITNGIESNWYRTGQWSKARPFIQETIKNIMANPQPLVNAIKTGYRQLGFKVR